MPSRIIINNNIHHQTETDIDRKRSWIGFKDVDLTLNKLQLIRQQGFCRYISPPNPPKQTNMHLRL